METYINIKLLCEDPHKENITELVEACSEWRFEGRNKEGILSYAKSLGKEAEERVSQIFDNSYIGEYLENLRLIEGKTLEIWATCSSGGEQFLVELMETFAPYVNTMTGTFQHDEESEEPIEYKLIEGKILLDNIVS